MTSMFVMCLENYNKNYINPTYTTCPTHQIDNLLSQKFFFFSLNRVSIADLKQI